MKFSEKISILVKILEKFLFESHFRKKSILVKFFEKFRFWSNFQKKNFDFGKFFENLRF